MASLDQSQPLEVLQQIDACCDRFETEWSEDRTPSLDAFLAEGPAGARGRLLGELLAIELEYRRDPQGNRMSAQAIAALHPELEQEVLEEFCRAPTIGSDRFQAESRESGLHIRCPHCENPVELLEDTPLEEITCRTCGSNFTLIGQEDPPRGAAPAKKRIGRFELLSILGSGGFGSVWKAKDTDLDRLVALKIPRRGQISRTEAELFFREARAAAQLRHPHIVPVHEVGRDGETIFIVSDLIHGEPLSETIKDNRPGFRETAGLLAKVCDALAAAHERGVVHRDLKPSNVMIDESGEPFLMDFGLAKRQAGEVTMTVEGQILGTPAYMSPEQAAGDSKWIDRRTDLYSLGVMLFEMLTGELPFRGSLHSQIRQRLEDDAPSPRKLNQRAPEDLATIALKCLERDPNRRYANAKELGEEFRRYLRGEPIQARPLSVPQRAVRWAQRNPLLAALALLICVLAIAGPTAAAVISWQRQALQRRYDEAAELIRRNDGQRQADAQAIARLRQEIHQLTSANPAAAQLPDDWRRTLAREYLAEHYEPAVDRIAQGQLGPTEAVATHLALARLLRMVGRRDKAAIHYETSHGLLVEQVDVVGEPAALQLADCCVELASLYESLGRRADSDNLAAQALDLRGAPSQGESSALRRRIDWLYSVDDHVRRQSERLAGEPLEPGGEGARLLREIQQAREGVDAAWSADPGSVVEVSEALTGLTIDFPETEAPKK